MKDYINFINEKNINILKYHIYDWDDNLLMMDTKIYCKHKENGEWVDDQISTKKLVDIKTKYDKYWDNPEYQIDFKVAYLDFRDFGPKGNNVFLDDTIDALNNKKYGPSWENFISTLVNGRLFSIVTTRGHEWNTIRKSVEYIIYNELNQRQQDTMLKNLIKYHTEFDTDFDYLIDDYLKKCIFIGIMSNTFIDLFSFDPVKDPNKGKQLAVQYSIDKFSKYGKTINTPTKIGFSDDDTDYYKSIKHVFMSNKELLDDVEFSVFDTSDPSIKGGIKEDI